MTLLQVSLTLLSITSCPISVSALSTKSSLAIVENRAVPGLKNGMDYCKVGTSNLVVSKVCMGTMTFGEQNTIDEGVEQLNKAWDEYGVNFLDTAEMYPVPTKAETAGRTDQAVAKFIKSRSRDDVILATKVAGRSERINWLRKDGSSTVVNRKQILESVDASLSRLGVDYIDLLQIHWPDRYIGGLFGQRDFSIKESEGKDSVSFEEQLSTLKEVVDSGKVRYIGVSNETPYGVCSMVEMAKHSPELYPRIVSIQNGYSLVDRKNYEAGLTEACYHHDVALLPYSPLAGGVLTGKYSKESVSPNARMNLFPGFMARYRDSQNEAAVDAYMKIAEEAGLSPAAMALSWCYHRDHVCSTIIGATTLDQLDENIKAYDVKLGEDVLEKIHKVYQRYTDPTKAYGS
jgi:aryl-alcohol dehydrogenase-like predicted oxidoreductase